MQKTFLAKVATLGMALVCPFTMGFAAKETEEQGYCANFRGAGVPTEYSETITYDHKETTTVEFEYGIPYYNLTSFGNICANMAGAVIIGYYDRFAEDLIPNFKAYMQLGSYIRYKGTTSEVSNVIDKLYDYMGTDVGQSGTDFSGFNSGMAAYAATYGGYTYTQSNVWGSNLTAYKNAIAAEKPVAVFATGFSLLSSLSEGNGVDTLGIMEYDGDKHVMVGYGYRIDNYYNSSNKLIETRTYLIVFNGGMINTSIKYLQLDGRTNVDHAIAVTIS